MLNALGSDLAWPLALLVAWFAGELVSRWSGLPRIGIYAIVGFVLAPSQLGLLPRQSSGAMALLAHIGFGLILFEAGHRINLHWLRVNPWLLVTSVVEALASAVAVYALGRWFGLAAEAALLVATLAMATSPATIVRVINERRAAGQVTERILHLSALNCVIAMFAFKIVVGLVVFKTSGSLAQAAYLSIVDLLVSVGLGLAFGIALPVLLRLTHGPGQDATLAFALAVIALIALTHGLDQSPLLAALTFGLAARHRRVVLGPSQRGFGVLGELLALQLFVFVAATLDGAHLAGGLLLGLALLAVRAAAKTLAIAAFAHVSGISWRKGLLTGMAMTPISAIVVLLLEQGRTLGTSFGAHLAPLAAAALVLEIIGPALTQRALIWAREVPTQEASDAA